MARIRSIKPEIRRSLTVSSWPYPVRWTFAGLPGYLDDEGRGHDDTRLIKSELYPLDDDMTSRKLEHHLTQIAANGPLCRYEVEGVRYLHVTSWQEHQRVNRPSPSRIPPCPIHEASLIPHGALTEPSSPRAQARAPAEQGAGKGAGKGREQGAVNARDTNPGDDDTITKLLDQHTAAVSRPLPAVTIKALRDAIAQAVTDTHSDVELITAGLARLRHRGGKPGLLAHLIGDIQTERAATDPDDLLADPEIRAWLDQQEAAQ